MLIHVNEDERIPSLVDWCNKIVKKIFLEGDGLNQQQINVLEMMDKNNYTIIKSYRRAGLTTLMLMKMAYDILYRFEAYPLKIRNHQEQILTFYSQEKRDNKFLHQF